MYMFMLYFDCMLSFIILLSYHFVYIFYFSCNVLIPVSAVFCDHKIIEESNKYN